MKYITNIIGYAIAALGLVWVFHNINIIVAFQNLKTINWGLALLAIAIDIASYVFQGWRWQILLKPIGDISIFRTIQAIYIGLFTNEIIPLRGGEFVRIYIVSRSLKTKITMVFSSLIIERIFDGIWLMLFIALVALFIPLPKDIIKGEEWLSFIIFTLVILFLYILLRQPKQLDTNKTKVKMWCYALYSLKRLFHTATEAIHTIGKTKFFYWSFVVSIFVLICQALSFFIMLRAYHISVSLIAGIAIFLIVHLGTALPNTPSNIGSYQFFTVFALTFFEVDKTQAAGFSVVAFILLTLPLWALGLWAIKINRLTLANIKQEIRMVGKERNIHEKK